METARLRRGEGAVVLDRTPQSACDVCGGQGAAGADGHCLTLMGPSGNRLEIRGAPRICGYDLRKGDRAAKMPPAARPGWLSGISRKRGFNGRVSMKKFVAAALAAGLGLAISATTASAQ